MVVVNFCLSVLPDSWNKKSFNKMQKTVVNNNRFIEYKENWLNKISSLLHDGNLRNITNTKVITCQSAPSSILQSNNQSVDTFLNSSVMHVCFDSRSRIAGVLFTTTVLQGIQGHSKPTSCWDWSSPATTPCLPISPVSVGLGDCRYIDGSPSKTVLILGALVKKKEQHMLPLLFSVESS